MERALLQRLREFLLELGKGFAFLGSQYRIEVGGEEFFINLLLFHRGLRSLVAIELKTGDFKPEYAGKMHFYLNALDDLVRLPDFQSVGDRRESKHWSHTMQEQKQGRR